MWLNCVPLSHENLRLTSLAFETGRLRLFYIDINRFRLGSLVALHERLHKRLDSKVERCRNDQPDLQWKMYCIVGVLNSKTEGGEGDVHWLTKAAC